jgi:hypothetical protein
MSLKTLMKELDNTYKDLHNEDRLDLFFRAIHSIYIKDARRDDIDGLDFYRECIVEYITKEKSFIPFNKPDDIKKISDFALSHYAKLSELKKLTVEYIVTIHKKTSLESLPIIINYLKNQVE